MRDLHYNFSFMCTLLYLHENVAQVNEWITNWNIYYRKNNEIDYSFIHSIAFSNETLGVELYARS